MSYFRPDIDAIEGYTPGFQPKEEGFVKLNTNENPYPPSPEVAVAIKAAARNLRKYPDPMAEQFRTKTAEVLGTVPERILCGNGSDELLTIAIRSFCGEGDAVAFPTPTYSLYPVLADIQGARVIAVDFPQDYSLPEALASTDARLTLLCNPNAPSSTLIPPAEVSALAEKLSGVLLIDEAYVDFADDNCLELAESHQNVIVLRTLSKSYSLAGLRFGFAVAQEPLIAGMTKVKDSYNVDSLGIAGAAAAISDQAWMRRNAEKIKATRGRLIVRLRELGFSCWPPQTNFVLARAPQALDAREIYQQLFKRKILVRYWNAPRLNDCLRITVGSDAEIDVLLGALEQIVATARTGGT